LASYLIQIALIGKLQTKNICVNIHYKYAAVLAISYNTCSCDATCHLSLVTCHLLVAVQLLPNMLQSLLRTSIQQQLNLTRSAGRRNNRLGFTGWGKKLLKT